LLIPLGIGIVARAIGDRRPPGVSVMVALTLIALGIPPGLPAPETASVVSQVFGYALPAYGLAILAVRGLFRLVGAVPSGLVRLT
jgi:hypothetical protein